MAVHLAGHFGHKEADVEVVLGIVAGAVEDHIVVVDRLVGRS